MHPLDKARAWTLKTHPGRTPQVIVLCSSCPETAVLSCHVKHPPHYVANKFRQRGWRITGEGKKAQCPKCFRGKVLTHTVPSAPLEELAASLDAQETTWRSVPLYVEARELLERALGASRTIGELSTLTTISRGTLYRLHRGDKVTRESTLTHTKAELTKLLIPTAKKETPMTTLAPPTREALKQQRVLFTLLEDHYVEGESRYETGWSDERIASEAGLALTFVIEAREAGFGSIVDPALTGIESRMAALEIRIVGVRDSLSELVAETLQELHTGLKSLKDEIAELRGGRV